MQIDPRLESELLKFYREAPEQAKAQFGDEPFELKNILKYWVRSTNSELHVIPTDTVYMTIDKDAVRRSGMHLQGDSIPDRMVISLKGKSALYKGDLMMLEMIANANWERPIYVATTVGSENYMNLGDNFVQEGLANRITPFTTNINGKPVPGMKQFDTQKTYDNVMHHFKFGGLNVPGLYLDETVMRMCFTHRRLLSQLALNLVQEGDSVKAAEVLELTEKEIPSYNVPHDYASGSIDILRSYIALGMNDKAKDLTQQLWTKSTQYMRYYSSLSPARLKSSDRECLYHFYVLEQLCNMIMRIDEALGEKYYKELNEVARFYQSRGGQL